MSKKINYVAIALLILWASGCSDDPVQPPPPPPPPQLSLQLFSANTPDPTLRLPDDEVFDIFVDSQNRTWFSTDVGLALSATPGDTIQIFDDFSGIPNRKCRGIAELNGKIWVGTWGGGVASYDGTLPWVPLGVGPNRVIDGQVFDLAADDSSLWIATVNGVTQYVDDPNRSVLARFHQHSHRLGTRLGDRVITSIAVNRPAAEVWVSKLPGVSESGGGITILAVPDPSPGTSNGEIQVRPENSGIPDKRVSAVILDPSTGFFWLSFPDVGLASVDVINSIWTHFTTVDGFLSDLAQSLAVRNNGDIWVGTLQGVSRMTPVGIITNFTGGGGLPAARVRKVYVDGTDRVWLSFVEAGAGRVLVP